ncbi:ABC transporter ATP-binding protein [Diaminobutyricibacter sp. McL0618]|uniref:ABC transporter ATP-binding protein n=1 Tax=Leifsonia sp. McL0618 TaxID=3415677 RepID=UPI003CF360F5
MSLLTVDNLRIEFGSADAPLAAVDKVGFSIEAGEVVGLIGESGSGKSLTSRAIMGLVSYPGRVADGSITFDGRNVLEMSPKELRAFRAREVGMIFQDPFSSLSPVYRVGAQLAETLRVNSGLSRRAAKEAAVELLDRVGIPDPERRARSYPHELSGGQRQRVMIAFATAAKPRLLLADEPTTALDVTTQEQILALLAEMQRDNGMAMLLVSHDFGVIAQMCDRVVVMYGGRVVETGPIADIYESPKHPYTKALLASVPHLEVGDRGRRPLVLAGQPPQLGAIREGCVFAPRCSQAHDECTRVEMSLEPSGAAHQSACLLEPASAGRKQLPLTVGGVK